MRHATVKVLASRQQRRSIELLVNQASRPGDGRAIHGCLPQVVDRFVSHGTDTPPKLQLVGEVPADASVRDAVLLEAFPGSHAAKSMLAIAEKMNA